MGGICGNGSAQARLRSGRGSIMSDRRLIYAVDDELSIREVYRMRSAGRDLTFSALRTERDFSPR